MELKKNLSFGSLCPKYGCVYKLVILTSRMVFVKIKYTISN